MERRGRIDVLINNAGRGSYYPGSTTPIDEARAVFDLNFFAPLALAQLAIPHLRAARGALVNISSIAGQIPLPWLPVYSASKAALASITATQRMELRRDGVHVMGVFPGYVDTGFQANAPGPRPPERVVQGKRFSVSAADLRRRRIVRGIEEDRRRDGGDSWHGMAADASAPHVSRAGGIPSRGGLNGQQTEAHAGHLPDRVYGVG